MIPRATYRLQFNKGFGFDCAAALAPYLANLGVSHMYASPYLRSRPGSMHGYDIVDHNTLNPELGDAAAFARMVAAIKKNGLGQILDFVPNHMGVGGSDNPLWLDVLEWGSESAYAAWFDIDWHPEHPYLQNKLLVPFLADQYGVELDLGKLELRFDDQAGSFAVWAYGTHKLPVCPLHYGRILGESQPDLERLGDEFANLLEWRPHIASRACHLKDEMAQLAYEREDVRATIAAALDRFNGREGDAPSWNNLDKLIRDQCWRAAHFRVAADDINYRRFFNINDLAGIRVELPEVFEHVHRLLFRLLRDGILDGVRIDHIDGLLDPKAYLQRLRREALGDGLAAEGASFYLVVEKILARHESLREDWPVEGTTGYTFTNQAAGLLVDPAAEERLTRAYAEFTGQRQAFPEIVHECKIRITENEMTSELNVLAWDAVRVAHQNPHTADFTHNILRLALQEIVACYPVYRTYMDTEGTPTQADRRDLDWALAHARRNQADLDPSVFDFLYQLISGDLVAHPRSGFSRHAVLHCAMKLQQYSGPVMAKGLEDTAFYRYNRFLALNEVGGNPDQFGMSVREFHKASLERAKYWPYAMLTTSTHDTKRGEDARARLAAIAELAEQWAQQVPVWSRILRAGRGDIEGTAPPDRNDEYIFYQLLIASWPLDQRNGQLGGEVLRAYAERIKGAMVKSIREAKVRSTWAAPNRAYEDAVLAFVDGALKPDQSGAFLGAFLPFAERAFALGMKNSLTQLALKLTTPGVPDIYQGADLWDFNLVDPDNRRPVDYAVRIRLLDEIQKDLCRDKRGTMCRLLENWRDGGIKLAITAVLLAFRRQHEDLFAEGAYEPVLAEGSQAERVCAFLRRHEESALLVAVSRFPGRSESGWADTMLKVPEEFVGRSWQNILTGVVLDRFAPDTVFADLPVAVLALGQKPSASH
jgi:(1->4)-alpha-D-glucan 1-alpha-D-glucosylmutase